MIQPSKVYMLQCRLDTDLDNRMSYIPKHINLQDIMVEAELHIPVKVVHQHMNVRHAANELDETKMNIIAKGERADMFAKHLNEGKEMHFVLDEDLNITDFMWGPDCWKTVRREICDWDWEGKPGGGISTGEGMRPKDWDIAGSDGHRIWRQMIDSRKLIDFKNRHLKSRRFMFATVVLPEQYKSIMIT